MRFTSLLPLWALCGSVLAQLPAQNESKIIYQLSADGEFAFQLERILSLANGAGTNTAEVLRAASQITPGDFDSYYTEWNYLATKVHSMATNINATRSPSSARSAYFRASRYYAAAGFFLHGNWSDPRIPALWNKSLSDFDKGATLLPIPAERVNIIASNFTIPAIFYKASACNDKRPTLVAFSGYDGNQEDLYFSLGIYVLERGWNFLSFEGPGQPTVRIYQNKGFIPNWWDVVSPVVDYLETRDDVDTKRMALEGQSFGGLLVALAATHEHRFAAVLAIDGMYSLVESFRAELPSQLIAIYDASNKTKFDTMVSAAAANTTSPSSYRWSVDQGLWSFYTHSPYDWFTQLGNFNLTKDMAAQITTPVFVGEGQDDSNLYGQGRVVAQWLGNKSYYHLFTNDVGAGEHCQLGAEALLAQVSLDWVAEIFDTVESSKPM
ncbi:Alpha/Beta hydrolase protein [Lophiotrema nucula]|uniref:Alpha/Beta hydrolase protein n=1 Tax=Lophiotrema nucula TaxID=690887 RepID=A0A6A5ZBZ5_9PLEO|nr:Alpha/Beta hydrolase protein [Lophiotrema nucula]